MSEGAKHYKSAAPRDKAVIQKVWRVCLGPGKVSHSFLSEGPTNRVCARCRKIQENLPSSAIDSPARYEGP